MNKVQTPYLYSEKLLVQNGAKGIIPEMTYLVLRNLNEAIIAQTKVLDIGCGNGILSFACADLNAQIVTGLDIDYGMLQKCQETANTKQMSKDKIKFVNSSVDDFNCDEKFDVVLCNAAQLPLPRPTDFFGNGAYFQGEDGLQMINSILARLDDLLAPQGRFYLIHMELSDIDKTKKNLEKHGYSWSIKDSHTMPLYAHVAKDPELVEFLYDRLIFDDGQTLFRFHLMEISR